MKYQILLLAVLLGGVVGCSSHSKATGSEQSFAGTPACETNAFLQKYDCSLAKIEQSAERGDPDAQYALGYMYFYGIGTVRDLDAARLWIRKASVQGQPLAIKASTIINKKMYPSAGSASYQSSTQAKPASVKQLNAATPTQPLDSHLPNYGSTATSTTSPSALMHDVLKASSPAATSNATGGTGSSSAASAGLPSTSQRPVHDPRLDQSAAPVTALASSPAPARSTALTSEEHALLNAKTQYTLQLMASSDLSSVRSFIQDNHLRDAHYYRANHNGKQWYVLLYGSYQTAAQAHQALAQLPPSLSSVRPWVKSFRIVKQEIRSNVG